jgi:hypothetical protein
MKHVLGQWKKREKSGEFLSLVKHLRCGVHNGDESVKLCDILVAFCGWVCGSGADLDFGHVT